LIVKNIFSVQIFVIKGREVVPSFSSSRLKYKVSYSCGQGKVKKGEMKEAEACRYPAKKMLNLFN
jgi:hypothetical protein